MEHVVPGILQRLSATDIIRMAGLAVASMGLEYCRSGAVRRLSRRGVLLAGVVDLSQANRLLYRPQTQQGNTTSLPVVQLYSVEIELQSPVVWVSKCSCKTSTETKLLCAHVAALLYQWLAEPMLFEAHDPSHLTVVSDTVVRQMKSDLLARDEVSDRKAMHGQTEQEFSSRGKKEKVSSGAGRSMRRSTTTISRSLAFLGNVQTFLSQISLSELRSTAREYNLAVSGLSRQQIADAVYGELKKPDAVRRVAATLEKAQRQLLAALILAGGAMSDDDLRGLFERFSLGQSSKLQQVLLVLQGKALLFRTSLNASSEVQSTPHRLLNSALLDVGWYVPLEVCSALRVSVPVTTFDITCPDEHGAAPLIQAAVSTGPLALLLLVARVMETTREDQSWLARGEIKQAIETSPLLHDAGSRSVDGSVAIPSPPDQPSFALAQVLQEHLQLSSPLLIFLLRVLRSTTVLQMKRNDAFWELRSDATERFLGADWSQTLHVLFDLWLTQCSYGDLYDLKEDQLRLRCRATSLQQPVLRFSELENDNIQARRAIMALLAQAPLNQWISFSAFARFVYRLNPLFLQHRQRLFASPQWWLELEEGCALCPLQLGDWLRAEQLYLMRLLAGPLHWWGVCDIATSSDGHLLAFRLTPLAGWLLNGNPLPVEQQQLAQDNYQQYSQALTVTEDGEILIACSQQNWPVVQLLETFTEVAGVRQGLLCYRLSARVFGQALGNGLRSFALLRLFHLIAELKAVNDQPQGERCARIAAQLEQWQVSYGRVRLYTGVILLETADTFVMREIIATTSLQEQIVQLVQPTVSLIKPETATQIIDELKQRGQTPLLYDEDL
jgi:hypothetical protein